MASALLENLSAASTLAASDLFYVKQAGARGVKATGTQLLALVGTAYVPLAGGTMTGGLTLPAGTAAAPALLFTGGGSNTGLYLSGASEISIAVGGTQRAVVDAGGFYATTTAMGMYSNTGYLSLGLSNDIRLYRDAAATLAQRNGTNAQTLRVYSTYTSASVYSRASLAATTTAVTLAAEELSTGSPNVDIVLTPAGTGRVRMPSGVYNLPGIAFNAYPTTGFWLNSGGDSLYATIGAVGALKISALTIGFHSAGVLSWSSSGVAGQNTPDAGFSRNSAGVVEFNDGNAGTFRDVKLRNLIQTEYSQLTEMTAPSAPATNSVRIYAEDNGSGKTRLMALFATGAAQQISIEP